MTTTYISPKVLVTGASGFIGLHTVLHLLQCGYRIRATIRSETNEKNTRATLSKHVDTNKLELVCADLLKDDGWREAMRGCDFAIHVASPFIATEPKDENELIIPARDGTLRVLRAAQAAGIRRVVMLSTIGAVYDGHLHENRIFDENDWSDLGKIRLTYHKSKTLAEQAAWEFIGSAENRSNMELVTIVSTSVFGPVLDNHNHTSIEWYRALMHAEVPGVPRYQLDFVDVRDLVDVLKKAMLIPEAAGKRFLCNSASIPLKEFADILQKNFSTRSYRIPNRILPDWLFKFVALFVPKARWVAEALQWNYAISTEQAKSVFDWQPRPYQQTIVEMAETLIEYGLV